MNIKIEAAGLGNFCAFVYFKVANKCFTLPRDFPYEIQALPLESKKRLERNAKASLPQCVIHGVGIKWTLK